MIRLLVLVLLAGPAAAQRSGCGMGLGLDALRAAEASLREGVAAGSLIDGREAGGAAAEQLAAAAARLAGCGCHQVAGHLQDAAAGAEATRGGTSAAQIRRSLERVLFSTRLARDRLDRQGCS